MDDKIMKELAKKLRRVYKKLNEILVDFKAALTEEEPKPTEEELKNSSWHEGAKVVNPDTKAYLRFKLADDCDVIGLRSSLAGRRIKGCKILDDGYLCIPIGTSKVIGAEKWNALMVALYEKGWCVHEN